MSEPLTDSLVRTLRGVSKYDTCSDCSWLESLSHKAADEIERLRAYADGETDKLRDALRKLDEQWLPDQRSVLHLIRAEEDGRIHFESESGNHVGITAEAWGKLGEPNTITIGVWAGVL